ncbi:MAG: hypothetical protein HQL48_01285 [Gammaproteobacteria bacterium]|nr:hypothetical protein [Gammaproteobacteria bacterium]
MWRRGIQRGFAFVLFLLLSGCSLLPSSERETPPWLTRLPQQQGKILGVGRVQLPPKSEVTPEAKEEARQAAIAAIMATLPPAPLPPPSLPVQGRAWLVERLRLLLQQRLESELTRLHHYTVSDDYLQRQSGEYALLLALDLKATAEAIDRALEQGQRQLPQVDHVLTYMDLPLQRLQLLLRKWEIAQRQEIFLRQKRRLGVGSTVVNPL